MRICVTTLNMETNVVSPFSTSYRCVAEKVA